MKTYILPIIIFLFSLSLCAQQPNKERIDALKVAFITEKLDLTKKEAEEFWPIYNEFNKTNGELRHQEIRSIRREIRENLSTMTNERAEELIEKITNLEARAHKNRMEFAKKIRVVLPAKKIIQLKVVEDDFKRKMLDTWKNRRRGQQGNKP